MLASLACASRRLACRYWRIASPLEKTARPHAVSRVRDEVKRALRCARRAPRSPWVPRRTARSWRGIVPLTHLAREGRMTVTIGLRELLAALGGAAAAWPLAARAQPPAMPVIGFLDSRSPDWSDDRADKFRHGLKEAGFIEGQNVAIEFHSGRNSPLLVADLLRRQVALIVGNTPSALAAKAATTTVPIVFATGFDPVRNGLVTNLNRPGGNVTGVSFMSVELAAKQLAFLRELRPGAARIAVLVDPKFPTT